MTRPQYHQFYQRLEHRVGRLHLRQRLGIESDREALIFGQGLNFFHIENWYSIHAVIRNILRLFLVHRRGRRNALDIRLRHNEITLPGLPAPFEGFTILHLSDLHLDMNPVFPRVLSERLQGIDYDLCVMTGDFRYETFGPWEPALAAMEQVRPHLKDPVYGVLGNHDSINMLPALEDMGIRLLMNESVALTRGNASLHLAGIDDPHYYRADNLEKACQDIPHDAVSVLLSHTPEIFRHAAHSGFDLMLCGHTHGGQIGLPGGIPILCNAKCPRRLCAGPWTYHRLTGYTSVGTGSSVVDVRLNTRPEIVLHRLHCG